MAQIHSEDVREGEGCRCPLLAKKSSKEREGGSLPPTTSTLADRRNGTKVFILTGVTNHFAAVIFGSCCAGGLVVHYRHLGESCHRPKSIVIPGKGDVREKKAFLL